MHFVRVTETPDTVTVIDMIVRPKLLRPTTQTDGKRGLRDNGAGPIAGKIA